MLAASRPARRVPAACSGGQGRAPSCCRPKGCP